MNRKTMRGGFTLTDLTVSLVLLVLLATATVAGPISNAIETSNRIKCAKNLKQIGLAMIMYSNNERNGSFPRALSDSEKMKPTAFTRPMAKDPFKDGPGPNDVTAALFLLLRTQEIQPKVFVCPSTVAAPFAVGTGKKMTDYSNFQSEATLSYSMSNPYPGTDAIVAGFKWNNSALGSDFAIAGDMNPGSPELKQLTATSPLAQLRLGNSHNHGGAGQNVLYADGHVDFQKTPFCGQLSDPPNPVRDNIYTYGVPTKDGSAGIVGPPMTAGDSVLLPVDDGKISRPATAPTTRP